MNDIVFEDDDEFGVVLFADQSVTLDITGSDEQPVSFVEDNPAVALLLAPMFRGPVGPTGGQSYTHTQTVASSLWTVNHMLGRYPHVTVMDSAGSVIEGDVTYVDLDHLTIAFGFQFAGTATL